MKHALLLLIFCCSSLCLSAQTARPGQAENLRAYPNPVVEYFQIGHSEEVKTIRVINMVGREVRSFTYQAGDRYVIGDLPRGMYALQMRDEENRVLRTQRITKR